MHMRPPRQGNDAATIHRPAIETPSSRAGPSVSLAPSDVSPATVPHHDNLNATVWMQHAVEFRAVAQQAYRAATAMLDAALADPTWTAAPEQVDQPGYEQLPPAVVLDVDETVLDSQPFQGSLVRDGAPYSTARWKAWVSSAVAAPVPGALAFTRAAQAKGVRVVYLTNRDADVEAATRTNLAKHGFPLTDDPDDVITQGEIPAWAPSDKGPRRRHVAKRHRILLLIGDNLNDFVSGNDLDLSGREALFAQHAHRFGRSWIVLPNPQYGSWELASFGGNFDLTADERRAAKRALLRSQ